MKKLSDRIRAVRKKLGMNQVELADILGCTDGKIKAWEQETTVTMKAKDALLLSQKFGFSQEWLMDGEGEMLLDRGELLLDDISKVKNLLDNNLEIPFYTDIRASAGYGCTNTECEKTSLTISKDMLPSYSKDIDAIRVSGNSMTPTIDDDDVIFIDKTNTAPSDGKIFVVYLCEDVYVKRIFIDPKTKEITLHSDNQIFPQIKADCEDFKIIGRVIANMKINKL